MIAYDVENRVFAKRKQALTMQECRDIADKLFAHFGVEPIPVDRTRGGRARSSSHYWHPHKSRPLTPNGFIRLSNDAADWLVCHEVAHYLAYTRGHRGHGKEWKALYIEAVRLVLGENYALRLGNGFRLKR